MGITYTSAVLKLLAGSSGGALSKVVPPTVTPTTWKLSAVQKPLRNSAGMASRLILRTPVLHKPYIVPMIPVVSILVPIISMLPQKTINLGGGWVGGDGPHGCLQCRTRSLGP